jgi:hypothetical protein
MALIERFTPGGNFFPDGQSTFAVLREIFVKIAETRDLIDQRILTTATSDAVQAVTPNLLQPVGNEDFSFAITDEDGRRLWLEAAPDGGPTAHSAKKMAPALTGPVGDAIGFSANNSAEGLAFAVVDEDGRRTWIEATESGGPSTRSAALLRDSLGLGSSVAFDDWVVSSGDSMTGGAFGTPYPSHLATLTGWNVKNYGVGGETSVTIGGRMGGRPMLVQFPGGQIPAEATAVAVTFTSDTELTGPGIGATIPKPLLQQWNGFHPAVVAGVTGTFQVVDRTVPTYTFTRSSPGTAVTVDRPVPLTVPSMVENRGSIHVMWWGHNDGNLVNGVLDYTDVIARQQAMIRTLAGDNPRYIVLGPASRPGAERRPNMPQFLRAFGERFVNVAEYLISDAAFIDAGITPTAQDETDRANGWVPSSFRGDGIHLTDTGNRLVAQLVANKIRQMGWLD